MKPTDKQTNNKKIGKNTEEILEKPSLEVAPITWQLVLLIYRFQFHFQLKKEHVPTATLIL